MPSRFLYLIYNGDKSGKIEKDILEKKVKAEEVCINVHKEKAIYDCAALEGSYPGIHKAVLIDKLYFYAGDYEPAIWKLEYFYAEMLCSFFAEAISSKYFGSLKSEPKGEYQGPHYFKPVPYYHAQHVAHENGLSIFSDPKIDWDKKVLETIITELEQQHITFKSHNDHLHSQWYR